LAKKEPVSVNWQTVFIFIPLLAWLALYKIEKLRWGLLIGVLFAFVGFAIENPMDDTGEAEIFSPTYQPTFIASMVWAAIIIGVWVYLIRRWSREWNEKIAHMKGENFEKT